MKVAEILSDLTSLRACDPSAALAFVSARPSTTTSTSSTSTNPDPSSVPAPTQQESTHSVSREEADHDPDLIRAKDIMDLHYSVKVAHRDGVDKGLVEARRMVEEARRGLRMG